MKKSCIFYSLFLYFIVRTNVFRKRESGRHEEESALHAKSKDFRSAHQPALSGKQTIEKNKRPLLRPRIESLSACTRKHVSVY